ncbi:MAG: 1,2-dihydroxy-3-keto-5-methylthiopentene dioxygenase [Gammaproteobacteria bacterium]
MSALTVYAGERPDSGETVTDFGGIRSRLDQIGVQFERWTASRELPEDADQEAVISAYRDSIDRLKRLYGFKSVDVVSLKPDHPEKDAFRQKFLSEHTHDDFEVRFFIDGKGLFYLHVDKKVYAVLCEKGDLISVPAKTLHWFDMGEQPSFKCIRLFTTPEGWAANFTGNEIAKKFPTFDQYVNALS